MKRMLFIIAVCMTAALTLTLTSCHEAEEAYSDANEPFSMNVKADSSSVKNLGRTYYDGETLWLGFSASGAAFRTNTSRMEVTFAGSSNRSRVAVFVDGERKADILITRTQQTNLVFENLGHEEKLVEIIKLTESGEGNCGTCGIRNIKLNDESVITPAEKKTRKIEFIGDSITCGYGVDDENKNHKFKPETEDASKSYAFKTARALDADWSFVSMSGWGIISGWTGTDQKNDSYALISNCYDKFGYGWGTFGSDNKKPQDIDWDFSLFQPDLVVINLGTNDNSWVKGNSAERTGEFKQGYVAFLKTVRQKNPDAKIACTLGLLGAELYPAIQEAVAAYSGETGDTNIFTVELPITPTWAADWHPTEAGHQKAAAVLIPKIKTAMGW